jgi:hypothetical protein
MKIPQPLKKINNEKGMVLVIAVMLLAVLVVVGFTAATMTSTDSKIGANYRESQRALYNAEAGSDEVIAYLRDNLESVTYPTTNSTPTIITIGTCPTGECITIPVTAPSGITFNTPVNLYCYDNANNLYVFRVTGTGYNNASRTIEVIIKKIVLLPQGADGAVAMYGGGPAVDFKTGAGGGYAVDGHDYPIPADPNCNGSACETTATALPAVPGLFTVMTPTLTGEVSAHLGGVPTQQLGASREAAYDAYVQMIVDSGSTATPLYQSTLGTRANPAVTVIPNGVTLNGTGNGAGIIIIDDGGQLNVVGNFEYEGLVILRGSGRVFGAGTANIFGSLLTIGHTAKLIDLTGGVNLFYSSAALSNLSNIQSSRQGTRIAWRDVN